MKELKDLLEILIDAAIEGSQSIDDLIAEFADSMAEYFEIGGGGQGLLDKARMRVEWPLGYNTSVDDFRRFTMKSFNDLASVQNSMLLHPDKDSVARMLAGDLSKILTGIKRIKKAAHGEKISLEAMFYPDSSGNRGGGSQAGQHTMSRSDDYPYDREISYGRDSHDAVAMSNDLELDRTKNVWEDLAIGCGLGDGMDPFELELDALRGDFKTAFLDALNQTDSMDSPSLFGLLNELDPEFAAQTFAPEEDDEMRAIYQTWGGRVLSPDEEQDEV